MNQKSSWQKEYSSDKGVPTTDRSSPSGSVTNALSFLKRLNHNIGKNVIDLGCGFGRNAIYLAKKGFHVTAIDFVEECLQSLRKTSEKNNVANKIRIVNTSISGPLPFEDNSFDLALDIVSSMSLTSKGIKLFEKEVKRVLRPGGFFIVYVLANDDEYMVLYGDEKKGTYVAPESGIVEHCRTQKELETIYKNWETLKLEKIKKKDDYYGKRYMRRLWWGIMRNK